MSGSPIAPIACIASLALFSLALPQPARADERDDRIQALEERVAELDRKLEAALETGGARDGDGPPRDERYSAADFAPDWVQRIRLSGSGNLGYFEGDNDSVLETTSFAVWDARVFLDADLGEELLLGDHLVAFDARFTLEWDLVRLGELENRVGEVYAELRGLGGSEWLNLQVGRFQVPVGEAYLRYSKGYADKPFITNNYGPWFWDEGIRIHGSDIEQRYGYVASVSDGDSSFSNEGNSDKQVTLKLFARPWSWLYLSVSGARSGRLGSRDSPAAAALWLGESWARAFGSGSAVPNFIDGVAVPDGPNELRSVYFVGGDVILERPRWGQIWLAYGSYKIDSDGGRLYDTRLQYWIAEVLLEGERVASLLEPFYLGLRATGLGGYDSQRGYLLDSRYADSLGYNMESMTSYAAVLGWRLNEWLRLRLEFSHVDIDLVDGLPGSIRSAADSVDSAALELGIRF